MLLITRGLPSTTFQSRKVVLGLSTAPNRANYGKINPAPPFEKFYDFSKKVVSTMTNRFFTLHQKLVLDKLERLEIN